MEFRIAVLPGDGIGPEVVGEGIKTLNAISDRFHHAFVYRHALVGGIAIDTFGKPLPAETIQTCRQSDAVMLGALGGPKWNDNPTVKAKPAQALAGLRTSLRIFANLRPVRLYPAGLEHSSIKPERLQGLDLVIVSQVAKIARNAQLPAPESGERRRAIDVVACSERDIDSVLRLAFVLARRRGHKLTSVCASATLSTSALWRDISRDLAAEYSDVAVEHLSCGDAARELIRRPASFDVIAAQTLCGDTLASEASALVGAPGMIPSGDLGTKTVRQDGPLLRIGIYSPAQGSAPELAGSNRANPIGMILGIALMLRVSFGLETEAQTVEKAVIDVLALGYRTQEMMEEGATLTTTTEMGDLISDRIHHARVG
jgi:3-isopropylmalate dehydrogenase